MGERITENQGKPSLVIEGPPRAPQIAKNIHMKNWFSIVFPCCTYISTVMRSAFADILVLVDVRGHHDPDKYAFIFIFFSFLYLNSKGSYQIA